MVFSNESSNPAFKAFNNIDSTSQNSMSFEGTLNKTLLLLTIVIGSGAVAWLNAGVLSSYILPVIIANFVVGLGIIFFLAFKPLLAKYVAPIYAVFQGVFLGLISVIFEMTYQGIVSQAIILTIIVTIIMNILYRTRIIKVTKKFRSIMMVAIFSIMGIYVVSFVMSFFGTTIPLIHENGIVGIGFSLVVVTIAALTLLLDFDFIDRASNQNLPKDMEWYGAFALMVTLVWLYLEILKLLSKLRSRN